MFLCDMGRTQDRVASSRCSASMTTHALGHDESLLVQLSVLNVPNQSDLRSKLSVTRSRT
jgi:hypothetical protein